MMKASADLITELPSAAVAEHAAGLADPQLDVVAASIAAGNTAGRLWRADRPGAADDPLFLLWDKGNSVIYLLGRRGADAPLPAIADVIASQIRPQALAEGAVYFKARPLDPAFAEDVPALFAGVALRELNARLYRFEPSQPGPGFHPLVDGARLAPIDRAFLADAALGGAAPVKEEIAWMWPSVERFAERGFGVAALIGRRVACWCTAEYVGPASCGIGIATAEADGRRGLATATAAALVMVARSRGLTPHWECNSANAASVRVAEKLGFGLIGENRFWAGAFAA